MISKAFFRMLGTLLGAAAAVVFLPAFVNEPIVLSFVLALWLGLCVYVSYLDRAPRSYVFLLAGYTVGCHSLRHVIGGRLDQISIAPLRRRAYNCATCFNRRHMTWAWCSLFGVAFADFYVRMCSMGVWSDWRIF